MANNGLTATGRAAFRTSERPLGRASSAPIAISKRANARGEEFVRKTDLSAAASTLPFALGALAVAAAAAPALAQDAAEAASAHDTIVITSQRREQSIQDVSLSVTAFDADTLDRLEINTTEDLSEYTPGLHIFAEQVGSEFYIIRGIGRANEDLTSDLRATK